MTKVQAYSADQLTSLIPWPANDAHKYSRGKAVLVAGSAAYPGAACLAARACERMGAGYTQVLCAPEAVALVRAASPSLVVSDWSALLAARSASEASTPLGGSSSEKKASCSLPEAQAYLVGSGFDAQDPETAQLALDVLSYAKTPVVVDGGGLAVLSIPAGREALKRRFEEGLSSILTPHAGEARRLAEPFEFPAQVLEDVPTLAQKLSLVYGAVMVLKGPVTYISDGEVIVCMDEGTPALAKAGTGDVLAGMMVSLLAQGLDLVEAAALATQVHALAGKAAAQDSTEICVCAGDLPVYFPQAIHKLKA